MIWHLLCRIRQFTGIRWPHWLYLAYLRSNAWQHIRRVVIMRAEGQCELCGKHVIYFEVHHLSYMNLGNEPEYDLAAICKDCHKKVHNIPGKERIP